MDLMVTTESDTYVYATSPISFAGLDPEDFLFGLIPMAMASTLGMQPLISVGVGGFCLWLWLQVTAGQPSGYLSDWIAAMVGYSLNWRICKRSKVARAVAKAAIKMINRFWIKNGLLPTPSYCNLYER